MFTGLSLNILLPSIGISNPLTGGKITLSLILVVFLLLIITRKRENSEYADPYFEVKRTITPAVLCFALLPFISIFGALFMNWWGTNILLIGLLLTIASIAILVAFDRVPTSLFPFVTLVISVSLLLHKSLITDYISGWDIQHEYWLSGQILSQQFWDLSIAYNTNATMSVTILAPAYSLLTGLSLVWVLKIVIPLLFSLMPLGLYYVFSKQVEEKTAVLSCFFFMAFFVFYGEMLALARQEIAELFLVLALTVMVDVGVEDRPLIALFLLFSTGIIVSHYATAYLFMLCLLIGWGLILILRYNWRINFIKRLLRKVFPDSWLSKSASNMPTLLNLKYILFFGCINLAWSISLSSSSIYLTVQGYAKSILGSLTSLFNPSTAEGLYHVVTSTSSLLSEVLKLAQFLAIALIIVGIFLVMRQRQSYWSLEFASVSVAAFFICVMALALPYFANAINTTRIYHIALIFLAPFCVVGAIRLAKFFYQMVGRTWRKSAESNCFRVLGVFFALFFLLNSGVLHELTDSNSISISLDRSGDTLSYSNIEVTAGSWLYEVRDASPILADNNRVVLLNGLDWWSANRLPGNVEKIKDGSLLFFGEFNIDHDKVKATKSQGIVKTTAYYDLTKYVNSSSCIYSAGSSQVHKYHGRM